MRHFEKRYAEWVVAYRWPVIAVTLVLVAIAASGSLFLTFTSDYLEYFSEDNPQFVAFEELGNTYGQSENVLFLIVPDDGDATSEQALSAAVWLTERAWQTPYSRRVDSIANFQHTTADGDDLLVRDLVDPAELGDAEARAQIRETALADPRLEGGLISRDGGVSVVGVTVELPAVNQIVTVAEVADFARALAAEAEEQYPGIDLRVVGSVMVNQTFTEASVTSQMIFLPTSLAIMALVLWVLTRGFTGLAATGLVIAFSILVSTGMGGWVGLTFSPPTAPAPTIVLMIVVANCVHLLVALQQRLRAGDSRRAAVVEAVRINLHPVFVASLTTALGFLSMNFSEVPPYRDLGNFVAFGIGGSFLLSVTFLPAFLSLVPTSVPHTSHRVESAMGAIAELVIRHRKRLLWGSVAVVLALLAAIPRNELNDVLVHFFDESVEFRRDTDFLDSRLSGNTVLEYSLISSGDSGVTDPAFLADVSAFAEWFRDQPSVRHVSVITDTFRQLNKSMHGDDPAAYRLPESRQLAAQYLLLYELSLPQGLDLNNQIDTARTATRMTVSSTTLSSREVLEINALAEAWIAQNAPNIAGVNSSGSSVLFADIGQRNIHSMLIGTAAVLLAISLLLILALRSFRLGAVSLVPNFVPGVMGFGVWGLLVGEVGLSLSVVVAMTIGIIVDDTVHFLAKYRRALREYGCTADDAVRYAFKTAGPALFTTTVVLVAGFLILLLSPLIPTAQVGLLTAMIIGCALLSDLLFLPSLLLAVDRRAGRTGANVTARLPG